MPDDFVDERLRKPFPLRPPSRPPTVIVRDRELEPVQLHPALREWMRAQLERRIAAAARKGAVVGFALGFALAWVLLRT